MFIILILQRKNFLDFEKKFCLLLKLLDLNCVEGDFKIEFGKDLFESFLFLKKDFFIKYNG